MSTSPSFLRASLAALLLLPAFTVSAQPLGASPATVDANDPAEQLARYLRLLAASPRDFSALMGAGRAALAVGDASAATGFFARADQVSPRSGAVKAGLATALVQMEQPREALKLFDEAVSLGIPEAQIASDRGLAHDLRGEGRRAQADYAIALRDRDDPETTRRLALSLAISGDRTGALSALAPLLRRGDKSAQRIRAFVLALSGDASGAERAAEAEMPRPQALAMSAFFGRLPALNPAEKAAAVNFGHFPSTGKRYSDAELFADAGSPTTRGGPIALPRPASRADAPLIPSGVPLGARDSDGGGDSVFGGEPAAPALPVAVARAPRRRPGAADSAIALREDERVTLPAADRVRTAAALPAPLPKASATPGMLAQRPSGLPTRSAPSASPPAATVATAPARTTYHPARGSLAALVSGLDSTTPAPPVATGRPAPTGMPQRTTDVVASGTSPKASAGMPQVGAPIPTAAATVRTPPVHSSPSAPAPTPGGAPSVTAAAVLPTSIASSSAPSASPVSTPPTTIALADLPPSAPALAAARRDNAPAAGAAQPQPAPAQTDAAAGAPSPPSPPALAPLIGPPVSLADEPPAAAPVAPKPTPAASQAVAPAGTASRPRSTAPKPIGKSATRRMPTLGEELALAESPTGGAAVTGGTETPPSTKPIVSREEKRQAEADAASAKSAAKSDAKKATGKTRDADEQADAKSTKASEKTKAEKKKQDAKDKALADAKAKQEADAKEAKAKSAGPERYWVQVASGANKKDLGRAWGDVRAKSKLLAGKTPWTTPWRASNRLLVGPFKSDDEAQAFVNSMSKAGMSGIQFTSRAGAKVEKLGSGE